MLRNKNGMKKSKATSKAIHTAQVKGLTNVNTDLNDLGVAVAKVKRV
jgi:hypothetical protein